MAALELHGETATAWGGIAQVSPSDLFELRRYRWWVQVSNGGPYAYTWARDDAGRIARPRRKLYMHRLIAETPAGRETDHRNRDTLDNRRENLRSVTTQENSAYRSAGTSDDDEYAAYLERRRAG
jgi:hypothetical protein